jgi:hypothetical protein
LRCLRPYRSRIRSHAYVRQKSKAAFDDFFHPAASVMILYRQPYQKNMRIINNIKRVQRPQPVQQAGGGGVAAARPARGRFPPRNLRF